MWVLIDNYDSFSYILLDYLKELNTDILVFKNDEITVEELAVLNPERIVLSPGPKQPKDAGVTMAIIDYFHKTVPILGICLGHQALGEYYNANLVKANIPFHGKTSKLKHYNNSIFTDIPQDFKVTRYHSLVLTNWENTDLVPLAFTDQNEMMAFQHVRYPSLGLQFHPEAILTEYGLQLLKNWSECYTSDKNSFK